MSMLNPNSKFLKSSTPRLTTTVLPQSYCILSIGQVMSTLMKKLPGFLLPNLDMHLSSLQISTVHTWPNLALCQVFPDSDFSISSVLHFFWRSHNFYVHKLILVFIYCRVISHPFPDPLPDPFLAPFPSP